jgi:hypothetical protein
VKFVNDIFGIDPNLPRSSIWWFCPVPRVGVSKSVHHQCRGNYVCLLPYCTLVYFRTAWKTLYSLFGDGKGRGYIVRLSFDVCQSHHQESAARMPQIFDHRSMLVSHTTRNLRHKCRRFSIIDQCLSVTPPGICGTNAADFRS